MSYFNPGGLKQQTNQWASYGRQPQQPGPSAALSGQKQPAYTPLGGIQPATKQNIDEYKVLKRRNSVLIIVLVVITILLIAAVVAVFTIAFVPKSKTSITTTMSPTEDKINVNLDVLNPNVDYGPDYANNIAPGFADLSTSTCTTLKNIASAKAITITECVATQMSAPTSGSGITLAILMTVMNNGLTDANTLIKVGATLISGVSTLRISATTITQVA